MTAITCRLSPQDHPVRPVCVVLIELGACSLAGQAVEIGEEVELWFGCFRAFLCSAAEIVDQNLGMYLLLDIEWRRGNHKIGPVLLILTSPYKLRVEVAIAAFVGNADRRSSSVRITDWYSAVGIFLREASSCIKVSTIFLASAFIVFAISASLLPVRRGHDSIIFLNSLRRALKSASMPNTSVNSQRPSGHISRYLFTPGIQ